MSRILKTAFKINSEIEQFIYKATLSQMKITAHIYKKIQKMHVSLYQNLGLDSLKNKEK